VENMESATGQKTPPHSLRVPPPLDEFEEDLIDKYVNHLKALSEHLTNIY